MHLERYLELDLSRSSEVVTSLRARLDQEVGQSTITLTPLYSSDGRPPYFTPEMNSWFSSFIQPRRSRALQELISEFRKRKMPRGAPGFLFENERDKIELNKFHKIQSERDAFRQREDASRIYRDLSQKVPEYEARKAEYGREAVKWTPILYWIVLYCIMVPEFLINWESFFRIPILLNTPALVLGLVILVAIFFAFSAHRTGMIIKQWQDRFGGAVSRTDKFKSGREFTIGSCRGVGWN